MASRKVCFAVILAFFALVFALLGTRAATGPRSDKKKQSSELGKELFIHEWIAAFIYAHIKWKIAVRDFMILHLS